MFLSGLPASHPAGTQSANITLDRTALVTEAAISDPDWSTTGDWERVFVILSDNNGNQKSLVNFGQTNQAKMYVSPKAKKVQWKLHCVILSGSDGAQLYVPASKISSAPAFAVTIT